MTINLGFLCANPLFADDYSHWDLNASYEFDGGAVDGLKVFIEGINITDENNREFGRTSLSTQRYTQTGSRWVVGASYSF